ncbi:helix-turn-helix domain-containing protein, partial [Bacteroides thetaiotaomicron]|uniref:helix-turn-helix domain-containing protein n=1 Tax=Bacteroides thetaiotaomicron TaxID=818 RepID=UPI0019269E83
LLAVLAKEPHRGFSREQLLGAGFDHRDSPLTVGTYVHYVRRKGDRDLIQTVRGAGYQLGTPA